MLLCLRITYCLILLQISFAYSQALPEDARFTGMSGASVAVPAHTSPTSNPAGLISGKKVFSVNSGNKYGLKALNCHSVSLMVPFKRYTFGLVYQQYGFSLYKYRRGGFSAAYNLTPHFNTGIHVSGHHLLIGGKTNTVLTADAGVQYKIKKGVFGVHVSNPAQTSWDHTPEGTLPARFRAGYCHLFSAVFLLSIEAEKQLSESPGLKTGLEYFISKRLYTRCGFALPGAEASFGTGFVLGHLQADLAFEHHAVLGYSSSLSLAYAW